MVKRSSLGRQRIAMEKISKKTHLQVTFSKRRAGLFKKASELCILCGVEIAIIVFSPANKIFSFSYPEVESILERFLVGNHPPTSDLAHQLIEAHRNAKVCELSAQLTHILDLLESEKKKGEELSQMRKASLSQCWWEAPIHELELPELLMLGDAMEDLKKNVIRQANKILIEHKNSSPFLAANCIRHVSDYGSKTNEFNVVPFTIPHVNNFGY